MMPFWRMPPDHSPSTLMRARAGAFRQQPLCPRRTGMEPGKPTVPKSPQHPKMGSSPLRFPPRSLAPPRHTATHQIRHHYHRQRLGARNRESPLFRMELLAQLVLGPARCGPSCTLAFDHFQGISGGIMSDSNHLNSNEIRLNFEVWPKSLC
jgi:hypothetical protein